MSNLRYHRCVRCHSIPFMRFLVAEQLCPPATSQLTALAIIPTRASTAHARDASHNVHPDSLEEISEIACSESSVARSKPEFAAGGRSADETAAIDTVARVHCLECRAIAVRGHCVIGSTPGDGAVSGKAGGDGSTGRCTLHGVQQTHVQLS